MIFFYYNRSMSNDLITWGENIPGQDSFTFMIAGFNQWANAGNVSSAVPEYLIEKLGAQKFGHINENDFYLYQLPGSHYLFRPQVKYVNGYEEEYQEEQTNDFYWVEIDNKTLIIFKGTEPNHHEDLYVNTLLDAAIKLGVKRIIVPSGVGGEIPFDKERLVSCVYSLKRLRSELEKYAVMFSNYNRNATIGMTINHFSKKRSIESIGLTARTPSYQFSVVMDSDTRAVYDILRRIRYMFGINLDLSDLERECKEQLSEFNNVLRILISDDPDNGPKIIKYMEQIQKEFEERRFEEPTQIPDVFLKEFDD